MEIRTIKTKYYGIYKEVEIENGKPIRYWIADDNGGDAEYDHYPTTEDVERYSQNVDSNR